MLAPDANHDHFDAAPMPARTGSVHHENCGQTRASSLAACADSDDASSTTERLVNHRGMARDAAQ